MTSPKVLYVAWRSPRRRLIHPLARLIDLERRPRSEFTYLKGARDAAKDDFVPFLDFPELDQVYRSEELFPLFAHRLMPAERSDFPLYLSWLGMEGPPGDSQLLGRSGGRKATDWIELFSPPELDRTGALGYVLLVRGIRHVPGAEEAILDLQRGDPLAIEPEPGNPVDPGAFAMRRENGAHIGYIPFYLCEDVRILQDLARPVDLRVLRVNPAPAPARLRLLCSLQVRPPAGFVPFSTERYQPLAADARALVGTPTEAIS